MRPDHTEWLVNLKVSVRRAVIRAGKESNGIETGTETLLQDGNDQFIDASTGGLTLVEQPEDHVTN